MRMPIRWEGFSVVGTAILGILSFLTLTKDTLIGKFLHWLPGWPSQGLLTPTINFLIDYTPYIGSLAFAMIFLKWTKDIRVLFVLALLFFLFVKFGLQAVGIGST